MFVERRSRLNAIRRETRLNALRRAKTRVVGIAPQLAFQALLQLAVQVVQGIRLVARQATKWAMVARKQALAKVLVGRKEDPSARQTLVLLD